MDRVDVWLVRFCPGSDDPVEALQRVFGISAELAREIEQTTPRIVKHGATKEVADQMVGALERIGAEVSCRPSRAAASTAVAEASEQAPRASPPASATDSAVGASLPPEPSTTRSASDHPVRPGADPRPGSSGASQRAPGSKSPQPVADLAAERAARQMSVPGIPVVSARSPQAARVTRRVSLPFMPAAVSNREASAAASTPPSRHEQQGSDDDARSASLPRRLRPAMIVGLPGGPELPSAPAEDEPSSPPQGPPLAKPSPSRAKLRPPPAEPSSRQRKLPPPPAKPSSSGTKKPVPPPAKPTSSDRKRKAPSPAKPAPGRTKGQAAPLKKRRERSGPRRPSGGG